MEAVTDTNFVDLYGSVVWAKSQPYPWWPCYIFDPEDFCKKENLGPSIKKRARASVSKNEYIVYFYGDEEQFGFVSPQNIKEFTTQFNLPTIHPCYHETHKKGIELARNECTLPKEKRVAWSRKHAMIENHKLLNPEEEIEIELKKYRKCHSLWINPSDADEAPRRSSYESRKFYIAEVIYKNKDDSTMRRNLRQKSPHVCSEK
eukprot:gene29160-38623_t